MVNKILIGNKCDLASERQVSATQGQQLADEYSMKFFECSARTRQNVDDAFLTLARDVVARLQETGVAGTAGVASPMATVPITTKQSRKPGACCK